MDTGKCVVNMMKCRAGEHCLFRAFGMAQVTDQVGLLRKAQITEALARWFPNVQAAKMSVKNGEYELQLREVEDGVY